MIEIRNKISLENCEYIKITLFTEMGRETVDWINNSYLRQVLTDTVRSDAVQ